MKAIRTTLLAFALISSASSFACVKTTATTTDTAGQKTAQAVARTVLAQIGSATGGQTVVH